MDFKYKKLKTHVTKSNIILLTILYHFNINTIFELFMKSKKKRVILFGGKKSPSNILPLYNFEIFTYLLSYLRGQRL